MVTVEGAQWDVTKERTAPITIPKSAKKASPPERAPNLKMEEHVQEDITSKELRANRDKGENRRRADIMKRTTGGKKMMSIDQDQDQDPKILLTKKILKTKRKMMSRIF